MRRTRRKKDKRTERHSLITVRFCCHGYTSILHSVSTVRPQLRGRRDETSMRARHTSHGRGWIPRRAFTTLQVQDGRTRRQSWREHKSKNDFPPRGERETSLGRATKTKEDKHRRQYSQTGRDWKKKTHGHRLDTTTCPRKWRTVINWRWV